MDTNTARSRATDALKGAMSRREVAAYIGLSEGQLRNPRFRGPKARKAGRRVLYLKEDVDRWLASLPVDSDPEAA